MGRHSAPRNPCGGVRTHTGSKIIEKEDLLRLANMTMPFGKYKGRRLIDLPEPYLLWMAKEGFPPGQLGQLLQLALEIKINGLSHLIQPLKRPPAH